MQRAAKIITGNFEYDIRGVESLKELGLMNVKESVIFYELTF